MSLPVYLAGLILATLVSLACLAAILIYFEPSSANSLILFLFYLSLFISATGIFSLINWFLRRISWKKTINPSVGRLTRQLEISFRQGLLLAIILVSILALQSQCLLVWWHLVVLVGLIGLIEWWLSKR